MPDTIDDFSLPDIKTELSAPRRDAKVARVTNFANAVVKEVAVAFGPWPIHDDGILALYQSDPTSNANVYYGFTDKLTTNVNAYPILMPGEVLYLTKGQYEGLYLLPNTGVNMALVYIKYIHKLSSAEQVNQLTILLGRLVTGNVTLPRINDTPPALNTPTAVTGGAPAAGVTWRIRHAWMVFTASAAVGNRTIRLELGVTLNSTFVRQILCVLTAVTAGQTATASLNQAGGGNTADTAQLADILLFNPNDGLFYETLVFTDAGDRVSILVEYESFA